MRVSYSLTVLKVFFCRITLKIYFDIYLEFMSDFIRNLNPIVILRKLRDIFCRQFQSLIFLSFFTRNSELGCHPLIWGCHPLIWGCHPLIWMPPSDLDATLWSGVATLWSGCHPLIWGCHLGARNSELGTRNSEVRSPGGTLFGAQFQSENCSMSFNGFAKGEIYKRGSTLFAITFSLDC